VSDGPAFHQFFAEFSRAKTLSRFLVVNEALVCEGADTVGVSVGCVVCWQLRGLVEAREAGTFIGWAAILNCRVLP